MKALQNQNYTENFTEKNTLKELSEKTFFELVTAKYEKMAKEINHASKVIAFSPFVLRIYLTPPTFNTH